MRYQRKPHPYELPRVAEPAMEMHPPRPYSPEAKAVARVRAAGLRWEVGVDHRGPYATVDGHTVRAKASCAEVLTLALEKALSA